MIDVLAQGFDRRERLAAFFTAAIMIYDADDDGCKQSFADAAALAVEQADALLKVLTGGDEQE